MRNAAFILDDSLASSRASVIASRDDSRLRRVVTAYFDFVARSLRGLGVSEADVDDAMQQVFIVAAEKIDSVAHGCERAYLFQIALRIASRARRTRMRRREVEDESILLEIDPTPSPEQLTDQRRARQMLDRVLDTMPLDLRSVFILFEFEELTMVEIADVLSIPSGTVASRLRRARELFQERVAELSRAQSGRPS
jgi:RNA polymerase sigma-70 factor (ECF subfamily)